MSEYKSVVYQLKDREYEEQHALVGRVLGKVGQSCKCHVLTQTRWTVHEHTNIYEIPLRDELHEDE